MKKLMLSLILAFAMMCLTACGSEMEITPIESEIFTEEEYNAAVEEVLNYFGNFEGCTMTEIHYAGDDAVKEIAKKREIDDSMVIVLESSFTTDSKNHKNGLEPNSAYEDYRWLLTRESAEDTWVHTDHGY